ncbi:MAG: ABC transporter permease, partial [Candidatus Helarchaeota archaeon]|nr:ABC transporter permease [Candidatus Helarchaeota archaeon]
MNRSRGIYEFINEFRKSKSGLIGLTLIIFFVAVSIFSSLKYPYSEILKWNDPRYWINNPTNVPPTWIQSITGKSMPETAIYTATQTSKFNLTYVGKTSIITTIDQTISFRYDYDDLPKNVIISMNLQYSKNSPSVIVTWIQPDGTKIILADFLMDRGAGAPPYYNLSKNMYPLYDSEIKRRLAIYLKSLGQNVELEDINSLKILFGNNQSLIGLSDLHVQKGIYRLSISFQSYNLVSDFSGSKVIDDITSFQLVIGGTVYGLMGTDWWGRDLFTGILLGAPVALLIGLLTSLVSVGVGVFLGVVSGIYGSRVDDIVQRVTDYFLILPVLPLLIFLSFILRPSIWNLVLLLSLFGWPNITKVVRSLALQIRESGYVEAAKALGASNMRILVRHVLPQTLPYAFANVALNVPGFIFAEASLSFLGLGDVVLPTWGKILGDAQLGGASVAGYWWWVLIPGFCIILVGMSFAL